MALDASIYARFAPQPKSVADFDREYEDAQAARQGRQMNALKLLMAQRQEQDAQRTIGEQEGIRNALAQLGQGATDEGRVNALRALGTQTAFGQADALEKSLLERKKTQALIDKDATDTRAKSLKMIREGLGFVYSNPTPEAAMQQIALLEQQLQTDLTPYKQQVAGFTTPDQLKQWAAGHALEIDKALPSFVTRDTGGAQQTIRQSPVTGQVEVINSVAKTQSPDNAASNARMAADAAANRAVQMRGQNMTDARQRDLNTITKEDKEANRKQAANEKAVTKFSDTLQKEGIPEIESALAGAEGIFQRYTDPKTGKLKDMPGVGKLTNALPDWAVSSEGKDVRESMSAVSNIVLSARSGAAVTDQELRRLARELSNSVGAGPEDMQRAYKKFRTRFDQVKANAAAGVSDAVLNEYKDRGGVPINRGGKAETKAPGVDALLEKYK